MNLLNNYNAYRFTNMGDDSITFLNDTIKPSDSIVIKPDTVAMFLEGLTNDEKDNLVYQEVRR